ncbi:hypothetical protein [Bacillus sp. OV166]|uniref:hypothetical protein n=1 Tax=Bacillus sp. OV166 TaxID=1882763 RepID=UPI000B4364B1|nr:hypothetical protein [Bacillus sp. OV166]
MTSGIVPLVVLITLLLEKENDDMLKRIHKEQRRICAFPILVNDPCHWLDPLEYSSEQDQHGTLIV